MAVGRDKSDWAKWSSLIAQLINQNREKGKPPVRPEQISPYSSGGPVDGRSRVRLTPRNIEVLKRFASNVD